MGWPIPEIPEKSAIPVPRYGRWFIVLATMVVIGSLLALFIGRFDTYTPALLYGALPAFFLWLCIFGLVLNRHDQSGVSAYTWHEETRKTKSQWQLWSREQVAVVGNVLLTPEADGVSAILGPLSEIPMFPQKARPIWGDKQNLASRFNTIDKELEQQSPVYRHHLYTIYILHSNALHRETIRSSVFNCWQLEPEFISAIDNIKELSFEQEIKGLALVLCLQYWPDNRPQKFSELISAQLLCSPEFLSKNELPLLAGFGRMMPLSSEHLHEDLDMLFEYNKLHFNELSHVWLSGETENNSAAVSIYADSHQWSLPKKNPVHYVDLTFGPPGELSFGVSLSMMVEAVRSTSKNQLIIYQKPQSSGWLCLFTRELFS